MWVRDVVLFVVVVVRGVCLFVVFVSEGESVVYVLVYLLLFCVHSTNLSHFFPRSDPGTPHVLSTYTCRGTKETLPQLLFGSRFDNVVRLLGGTSTMVRLSCEFLLSKFSLPLVASLPLSLLLHSPPLSFSLPTQAYSHWSPLRHVRLSRQWECVDCNGSLSLISRIRFNPLQNRRRCAELFRQLVERSLFHEVWEQPAGYEPLHRRSQLALEGCKRKYVVFCGFNCYHRYLTGSIPLTCHDSLFFFSVSLPLSLSHTLSPSLFYTSITTPLIGSLDSFKPIFEAMEYLSKADISHSLFPIRVLFSSGPSSEQRWFQPRVVKGGDECSTVGDVLRRLLTEEALESKSICVVVHGVDVLLSTPLLWLCENMSHADLFVYLVVRLEQ